MDSDMNSTDHTMLKKTLSLLLLALALLGLSRVAGANVIVEADSIRAAVIATLEHYAEDHGEKVEATVPAVADIQVPCDKVSELRVIEPAEPSFKNRMKLTVEMLDSEGEVARRIFVSAKLKILKSVAVAAGDIDKDVVLTAGVYEFREMDVAFSYGYFTDKSELKDCRMRRRVKAGTILTNRYVEPIPLVARGDLVIIRSIAGSVVVTASGTAREDGSLHESIRVYNPTTRKTLVCEVIDETTVALDGRGGYRE